MTQITGSYAKDSGDFEWTVSYHPDHWRVTTAVSGNAVLTDTGDEHSAFTRTTTDVLGVDLVEHVSLVRSGCNLIDANPGEAMCQPGTSQASGSAGFGVIVSGQSVFASYAYPGGLGLGSINPG